MASLSTLCSKRLGWLRELLARVAPAQTQAEVCHAAAQMLAESSSDICFALLYLVENRGEYLTLCESVGMAAGTQASAIRVSLAEPRAADDYWAMASVMQTGQPVVVERPGERFGDFAKGLGPAAPQQVLIFPLSSVGQAPPAGILIAGLNPDPKNPADPNGDRKFLELAAAQIGAALAQVRLGAELRAEAQSARDMYEIVLKSIVDLFAVIDKDWRISNANTQLLRVLEERGGNPIGQKLWDRFPNLLGTRFEHELRRAMASQRPAHFEYYSTPMGKWLDIHAYPSSRGLTVLARDITSRKHAEAAQKQSEERFRFLAEMVPSLVWTAGPDGALTYASARMRDTKEPLLTADSGTWVKRLVHPEDAQRYLPVWSDSLSEGKSYEAEIRIRQPDGAYRWCLTRAVPQKDASGDVLAWFGITTDIHDLKVAQEQLREVDHKKNEFLAMLAHELRNPLAPICNSLYLLRASGGGNPAIARFLEVAERQFNHMIRLIDDLLDLSRITRGKIELRKQQVELAAIVYSAIETSRVLIDRARHILQVSIPPEPLVLDADPVRLEQVIANLLNNSIKYMEEGGMIWVDVKREGNEAVVSVRDSGLGISADVLPYIFDMFAQAERTVHRAQGGLGIGLSLARLLVQLHGGRIEAHSEGRGKGSLFIVRLPLAGDLHPTGKPVAQTRAQPPGSGLSRHRLLIVDDNRDAAESLAMVLGANGADTRVVFDGQSALSEMATYRPSVVLLDLGMPGMDGYAVAERLRQDDRFRHVVLIAVSGWGQPDDRKHTQVSGFDHHLIKPVNTAELIALLAALPAIPYR